MVEVKNKSHSVLVEINQMLEQVEDAEAEKNKLSGRREEKQLQMERELGFKTIEEADKQIDRLDGAIKTRSSRINKELDEIKDSYVFQ